MPVLFCREDTFRMSEMEGAHRLPSGQVLSELSLNRESFTNKHMYQSTAPKGRQTGTFTLDSL